MALRIFNESETAFVWKGSGYGMIGRRFIPHLLILIIGGGRHLHLPYPCPPSLLSHSYFQRCLVSLTPVTVPLPFSVVQERRREAPAHHHHVPRGPPLACSSCCSVQLLLSIRPRPAGLVDSVRAEPLWVRASRLSSPPQRQRLHLQVSSLPVPAEKILFVSMAEAPLAQVRVLSLLLSLLSLAPAAFQGGCPSSCRCSFAMLQCLERGDITSIPALSPQESENMTEM